MSAIKLKIEVPVYMYSKEKNPRQKKKYHQLQIKQKIFKSSISPGFSLGKTLNRRNIQRVKKRKCVLKMANRNYPRRGGIATTIAPTQVFTGCICFSGVYTNA